MKIQGYKLAEVLVLLQQLQLWSMYSTTRRW